MKTAKHAKYGWSRSKKEYDSEMTCVDIRIIKGVHIFYNSSIIYAKNRTYATCTIAKLWAKEMNKYR